MKLAIHNFKEYGFAGIGLVVLLSLIAFVNEKSRVQRCQGIDIKMIKNNDQSYISQEDVKKYITKNGLEPLEGKVLSEIDLGKLEERIQQIDQIEYCEVYGDLKGMLHVKVKPYIPYARLTSYISKNDQYINESGHFFPLSKYHSERVLLLSGDYFYRKISLQKQDDTPLMELIKVIKTDDFWDAQISQMDVSKNGQIKFVPVLGNHIIEFGKAENIEQKLHKLKVFYKQVMTVKGWDKFSKIKLQYANQLVCE